MDVGGIIENKEMEFYIHQMDNHLAENGKTIMLKGLGDSTTQMVTYMLVSFIIAYLMDTELTFQKVKELNLLEILWMIIK